jgi:hypothetical protein
VSEWYRDTARRLIYLYNILLNRLFPICLRFLTLKICSGIKICYKCDILRILYNNMFMYVILWVFCDWCVLHLRVGDMFNEI